MPAATITETSELFNFSDSDVTFQSSDNVLFRVHKKNLEIQTGGFAPPEFNTEGKPVPLSEDSATLDLLFRFLYPRRHPDLESTPFEILAPLAEAAEKYEVFSAINICKIRMRDFLPEHAVEIMVYAAKHGYLDIVAESALLRVCYPLSDTVENLSQDLVIPWVRYYECWTTARTMARGRYTTKLTYGLSETSPGPSGYGNFPQPSSICMSCRCPVDFVIRQVVTNLEDIRLLQNLDAVFNPVKVGCDHIKAGLVAWRKSIELDVKQIPSFVTFL